MARLPRSALSPQLRNRRNSYDSGESMGSFTHFGGIALCWGRIFVTTFDGTIYKFELKGE